MFSHFSSTLCSTFRGWLNSILQCSGDLSTQPTQAHMCHRDKPLLVVHGDQREALAKLRCEAEPYPNIKLLQVNATLCIMVILLSDWLGETRDYVWNSSQVLSLSNTHNSANFNKWTEGSW